MTIEQLLGMSADELDKMTSEQKIEYFKLYLTITNPSFLESKPREKVKHVTLSKVDKVNDIFKQFGIDIKLK